MWLALSSPTWSDLELGDYAERYLVDKFSNVKNVEVVSGINLSMLLNIFNYPTLSLAALTKKALDGGKQGIVKINHERKNI